MKGHGASLGFGSLLLLLLFFWFIIFLLMSLSWESELPLTGYTRFKDNPATPEPPTSCGNNRSALALVASKWFKSQHWETHSARERLGPLRPPRPSPLINHALQMDGGQTDLWSLKPASATQ